MVMEKEDNMSIRDELREELHARQGDADREADGRTEKWLAIALQDIRDTPPEQHEVRLILPDGATALRVKDELAAIGYAVRLWTDTILGIQWVPPAMPAGKLPGCAKCPLNGQPECATVWCGTRDGDGAYTEHVCAGTMDALGRPVELTDIHGQVYLGLGVTSCSSNGRRLYCRETDEGSGKCRDCVLSGDDAACNAVVCYKEDREDGCEVVFHWAEVKP